MNVSLVAPKPELHLVPISQMLDTIWGDGAKVNQLIQVLFPRHYPLLAAWDRF